MNLRAGATLRHGRYLLVAPLGRGGFATVWRARDTRARGGDADVALKLLATDDGGAEAAAREAEVTARVRHPNVVTVRDTFSEGEVHAIVMELALGTLGELVEEQGLLSPGAAVGAVLQACEGLAAAHEAGVVHRDVKPQNLLVFPGGVIKLGDFGVARAEGHTRTRTANVLGSIPFMAPEQRRDPRAVRPATDVYAMAVTLAWLLTGRAPGDLFAPGALAELVEDGVPVTLAEVIVRAGAHDPRARPKDAAAFAAVVRGAGVAPEVGGLGGLAVGGEGTTGKPASGTLPSVVVHTGRKASISGVDAPSHSLARYGIRWLGWTTALALVGVCLFWALPRTERSSNIDQTVGSSGKLPQCEGYQTLVTRHTPAMQNERQGLVEAVASVVGDFDGDGEVDVAWVHNGVGGVRVAWSAGAGLDNVRDFDTPRLQTAAAGDIDGDGADEIVGVSFENASFYVIDLPVREQRLTIRRVEQGNTPDGVSVIDLNGDGRLDLLFSARADGTLRWRPQLEGGTFGGDSNLVDQVARFAARRVGDRVIAVIVREALVVGTILSDGAWSESRVVLPVLSRIDGVSIDPTGGIFAWQNDAPSGRARVVRYLSDGTQPCYIANAPPSFSTLSDVDGDKRQDFLFHASCPYCTSSYWTYLTR